jgi:hypothetical protein
VSVAETVIRDFCYFFNKYFESSEASQNKSPRALALFLLRVSDTDRLREL